MPPLVAPQIFHRLTIVAIALGLWAGLGGTSGLLHADLLEAETADEDLLGGASPPHPNNLDPEPADGQYKRIHQHALKRIVRGEVGGAIEYLRGIMKELPDDAESYFMLAVASAQTGETDQAEEFMNRAIELGTPPGRFIAGPRELLRPLHETQSHQQLLAEHLHLPVHGPMVGAVTDRSARIWVRTAVPTDVTVEFSETEDFQRPRTAGPERTTEDRDFTVVVHLEDLKPDTVYHYRVVIGEGQAGESRLLQTFVSPETSTKLRLAFGGGAGWVPPNERMWTTIRSFEPQALLLLGDNVYIDDPETPMIQRYCYYRRHSRPEWRSLVADTPVFAIWDDHDFGTDDSWGGPLVDVPDWKRHVWNVFKQNWVNPVYGDGKQNPGCWFDFTIGDIHFVMLDGRYYRTDAGRFGGDGVPQPSMLGPVQKQWLKDRLQSSEATFKVLVSPVPWDFRAKTGQPGLDTWLGYAEEREEIFSFIEDHQIEGVVLMSADRHRSDAWQIERPNGYDFFEFNSSRLTNQHQHETMDSAIFSYNAKQSFGLVTFDTTLDDPTVTYDVVTIDGEKVHSLHVQRSQLTFGAKGRQGRHAEEQQLRYVAPEARGNASGGDRQSDD